MKVHFYGSIIYVLLIICCLSIGCDDMQMMDAMNGDVALPLTYLSLYSDSEYTLTPINDSEQWSRDNAIWEKIKGEEAPAKPEFVSDWDVDLFDHWFYLYAQSGEGSRLVYDLGDHSYGKFQCAMVLPYFCDGRASVEMKWFVNNVEVFNSSVINTDVVLEVAFDLPLYARYLKLQVTNVNNDDECNYFVIGNPQLVPVDPALLMPEPVMPHSDGYLSLTSGSTDAITAINDNSEWASWDNGTWEKVKDEEPPPRPSAFATDAHFVTVFDHWFFSYAESKYEFHLKGRNYAYFKCAVVRPHLCDGGAAIEVIWFADNVEVYNSGLLTARDIVEVGFEIPTGTQTLTLQVTDGGNGNGCDGFFIGNPTLRLEKPEVVPHVFINPAEIRSPAAGQHFTVPINITDGIDVKGYTINVGFDPTALNFIAIKNADYLPDALLLPVVSEGNIQLTAVLLTGVADGSNGTLATITFEVVEVKPSDIQLSDVIITNSLNKRLEATTVDAEVVVP